VIILTDAGVMTEEGAVLLTEISVTIDAPRTAIIGANGSGKTTLARLLNGLTLPTSGSVVIDGYDSVDERAAVQRRVGFVFQDADHQLVYPTPLEDVALGLRAHGAGRREARDRALAMLARLGLSSVADQAIHTLSGGEKHLVALAGVLVLEPDWVVCDEPTTSLDLVNRHRVVDALGELVQRVVIVSHDLELVASFDAAILLDGGRVARAGPPDEVIAAYHSAIGVA
jgi:biotin transport system ATP-binding protein